MSNEFMLDPQDKDLFIMYCKRQAETAKQMAETMEKNGLPKVLAEKERMRVVAYGFVAAELESLESFSIGG